jgi:hypothetical protein
LLGVETGVSPEVCHDFLAESMNQHRNNGDWQWETTNDDGCIMTVMVWTNQKSIVSKYWFPQCWTLTWVALVFLVTPLYIKRFSRRERTYIIIYKSWWIPNLRAKQISTPV